LELKVAIENLFPTPIGCYKLDRNLTSKEIDFIKGQDTRPNAGNVTSINNFILRHKSMTKLRDFIETSLTDYFAIVHNPKNKVNLRITQSWCNYTEPGQNHHKHSHPNSFVSGVFYPQANREMDKIYFYRAGYQQIKLPPKNWNAWNSESWWFPVGTGDLILFPSSLEHMVETVQSDLVRISLSFNTFPVGNIGEEVDLTGLQIGENGGTLRIS
jgi:uncharacterized protein (TIGR02466 family)